ncbi:MAG TPA: serine hydrolase domain-containing protein, partial [Anditalea sp.]|nr:serine hydrolase domain-containing protein [Anditalea sp.]
MKFFSTLLIIILLIHFSVAQERTIYKIDCSQISTTQIDNTVNSLMSVANVTGLSLAILNDNVTVYQQSYGLANVESMEPMSSSTVLYGASFSKAVFAYLSLLLVQDGKLDLDRPLYRYLKNDLPKYKAYEDLADDDRWKIITPRMCLSHTTGFQNWRFLNARSGEFDRNGKLAIHFTPGTKYAYSGEGIALLQMVIEEITGKGLEELARERIFQPLGMKNSSYIWQQRFEENYALGYDETEKPLGKKKRKSAGAAGSLETTLEDYTKFIAHMMQGSTLDSKLYEEMISPQIRIHSKHQFPTISDETTSKYKDIDLAYGLGWGLLNTEQGKAFFKEGHDDGWEHYNINFVDKGVSIILMTNSSNGESIFKHLLEKIIGDTYTPWEWERYVPY